MRACSVMPPLPPPMLPLEPDPESELLPSPQAVNKASTIRPRSFSSLARRFIGDPFWFVAHAAADRRASIQQRRSRGGVDRDEALKIEWQKGVASVRPCAR